MNSTTWTELRKRAEEAMGPERRPRPALADLPRVLYELEVQDVELRLQHDELQRAQSTLAAAVERYRALFEEAPVAYLELDDRTSVLGANRAAVELFALDQGNGAVAGAPTRGFPLAGRLSPRCADALQRHLAEAQASGLRASCLLELDVVERAPVLVKLDTQPLQLGGARTFRTVVTEVPRAEVTEEHRTRPRIAWVVDDEPGVRRVVARMLRGMGHRVVVKPDATAVLDALERDDTFLDVLVTDVRMPHTGGVALAAEVRRLRPRAQVVFMSGDVGDARLPAGAPLLTKPFTAQMLRAIVDALVSEALG